MSSYSERKEKIFDTLVQGVYAERDDSNIGALLRDLKTEQLNWIASWLAGERIGVVEEKSSGTVHYYDDDSYAPIGAKMLCGEILVAGGVSLRYASDWTIVTCKECQETLTHPKKEKPNNQVEWDIDNNLPMYTAEFLKNLPIYVDGFRICGDSSTYFHPNDVELVMAGPSRPKKTTVVMDSDVVAKKFEYRQLESSTIRRGDELVVMNEMGNTGWELVSTHNTGPRVRTHFFKREIVNG